MNIFFAKRKKCKDSSFDNLMKNENNKESVYNMNYNNTQTTTILFKEIRR